MLSRLASCRLGEICLSFNQHHQVHRSYSTVLNYSR
ncbi:unnamed protein product [Rhodiola kirilowii]